MKDQMVERYLYDVVRRLPEKQKKDIEKELGTLIEDMIEERMESGELSKEECVKSVLEELGNPAKLAKSYRGENDCLIGGEYYDSYCYVLKIVLICTMAGVLISNIVSAVIHVVETEGMMQGIWNDVVNVANIPMALFQVFGVITLIYAVMERNHVKVTANEAAWTLKNLPEIPYGKAVISRGESAAGIIFSVLFTVLIIFAPQLLGAWVKQDGIMVSIPIFNLSVWDQVMPWFIIAFVSGIIDELVKLVSGRYNRAVMTVNIITNTINLAASCFLLKAYPIWNENFVSELEMATGRAISAKQDLLLYFNTGFFANIILAIIVFACMLDMGITIYRTLRYGKK